MQCHNNSHNDKRRSSITSRSLPVLEGAAKHKQHYQASMLHDDTSHEYSNPQLTFRNAGMLQSNINR